MRDHFEKVRACLYFLRRRRNVTVYKGRNICAIVWTSLKNNNRRFIYRLRGRDGLTACFPGTQG
jgi:hypothetical protein